jgi:hypothetical protein
VKSIDSIAARWAWFEQNVLDTSEATPEGIAEFRALFYAGAKACIKVIYAAENPDATVQALNQELDHYGHAVRRRGKI